MVPKVSFLSTFSTIHNLTLSISPRCTARPTNFDDDATAIFQSHHHTSLLKETFEDEPGVLWDGYGIIDDVTVCDALPSLSVVRCSHYPLAFHNTFSTSRHSRAPVTRSPPPSHQGYIQRPPC